MRKIYLNLICTTLFAVFSTGAIAQTIRYVKSGASGNGTGWNDAGDLQTMINNSGVNDEVWVAAGTYKPTGKLDAAGDDRDKTFILKAGVKIYGGFVGNNETSLSERNVAANLTILSGDLNNSNSSNAGDAYHVVASAGNSNGALLDGFTIQHGFANVATELAGVARNQGAGINITNEQTSVTFKNLIIKNNQSSVNAGSIVNGGAGVYLKLSGNSSTCVFENVVFDGNISAASGGNMYFTSILGSPTVTVLNSKVFAGRGTGGAGFYTIGSENNVPKLNVFNAIFSENRATATAPSGGALYLGGYSNTTVVNCTFYNNSGSNGGAIGYGNTASTVLNLYNSVFNANSTNSSGTTASDLRNLTGTTMNLRSNLFQLTPPEDSEEEYKNIVNPTASPLFLSTDISSSNFLQLVEGAATEKGDNSYVATYGLTADLAGNQRITHVKVDLGAYEYQGTLPVELKYFAVKRLGNAAELNWIVASESDNDKFVIERSYDGQNFNVIDEVRSKGDTGQAVSYNYKDNEPLNGKSYYKLSQTDRNGGSKVLGVRVLNFELSIAGIKVYPNPAKNVLKVQVGSISPAITKVRLVSLTGNTLLSKRITKSEAGQDFELNVRAINTGTYVLFVESDEGISDKTKVIIVK